MGMNRKQRFPRDYLWTKSNLKTNTKYGVNNLTILKDDLYKMQDDISVCNHINLVPSAELKVNNQLIVEFLLHFANNKGEKKQLSQGDMATVLNISWEMVNNSLIDLKEQEAIRINRNKILINAQCIKKTYE